MDLLYDTLFNGLAIGSVLVLAALWPWALGIIVVGPWLGHASWHAYRGSVEWEESPEEAVTLGSSN